MKTWTRLLKRWFRPQGVGQSLPRRPAFRRPSCRPRLEALEDRIVPSVTWTGAGHDYNWDNAQNWVDNTGAVRLPGAADDVFINDPGITVAHSSNVADSVNSLTSQAAIDLSGGSLSIANTSTINNAFTLEGATLIGGNLTVAGSFTWLGGGLDAVGGGATLTADGGTSIVTTPVGDNGYTLVNPVGQTASLSGGAVLQLVNGARLENDGTLVVVGTIRGGDATDAVDNYGTFVSSNDPTFNAFTSVSVAFNNYGTIDLEEGYLDLGRGGAPIHGYAGSSIVAAPGTDLGLDGPSSFAAGSSISVDQLGATALTDFNGSFSANTTQLFGATTFTGAVHQLGDLTVGATVDLTGAVLDPAARTLAALTLDGGTLQASGDLTVTGAFTVYSGGLDAVGGGATLTADGGISIITTSVGDNGYTLVNPVGQTASLGGGGAVLQLVNGARLENYGTLNILGTIRGGDATDAVDNYGAFVSSSDPTFSPFNSVSVAFNNYGTIDLEEGYLDLGRGGAPVTGYAGSSIVAAIGTDLGLDGPSSFAAASSLAPASSLSVDRLGTTAPAEFSGTFSANTTLLYGATTFTGDVHQLGDLTVGATVNLAGAALDPDARTLAALTLDGGTLQASGNLTVAGSFTWLAGGLDAVGGGATLTADGGISIVTTSVGDNGYTLVNPAGQTVSLSGGGPVLQLVNGARLENYGTVNLLGTIRGGDATDAVDNYGAFVSSSDPTFSPFNSVSVAFNNYGTIDLEEGYLDLGRGGAPVTGYAGSSIVAAIGTDLGLDGPSSFAAASSLAPASSLSVDQLTTTALTDFNGSFSANTTDIESGVTTFTEMGANVGSLTVAPASTLGIELSGAASSAPGWLVANGVTIQGGLQLSLANGSPLTLTGPITLIDNQGTGAVTGAFIGLPEGTLVDTGSYQFHISYVGGDGNDVTLNPVNLPPTASSGGPYNMTYGGALTLDTSASTDADGDALTYSWTINGQANAAAGVSPTLSWAQLEALGVNAAAPFSVSVTVDDGHGFSATASATVTVAKATPSFSLSGAPVIEDGTGHTTLSGVLSYGALIPTGGVMVTVNGVSQTAALGSDGSFSATFATSSLGAGSLTIDYSYGGDANFTDASATGVLDVTYGVLTLYNTTKAKQAGSTLPIQIELVNISGQDVSSANVTVTAVGVAPTSDPTDVQPAGSPGNSDPGDIFQYEGGKQPFYQFNLQIPDDLTAGSYLFYFTVAGDAFEYSVPFVVK